MSTDDPLADLRAATCSNGAPSARNLLVTVFGDALRPYGDDTSVTVASLAALLESFGVNERLVRTSLSRLVKEDLLAVRTVGRRAFYRVAPGALDLFRRADERIYRAPTDAWDGVWTLVVIDGAESTARLRLRLRNELAWAGFGSVAPNVMASPLATAEAAADAIAHVGSFEQVLITRSTVFESSSSLGVIDLAQRSAPLEAVAEQYAAFVERFGRFEPDTAASLGPALAFKLRTLAVASFRRIVLTDPMLPHELLADGWVGAEARDVAGRLYRAVFPASEAMLSDVLAVDRPGTVGGRRFHSSADQSSATSTTIAPPSTP